MDEIRFMSCVPSPKMRIDVFWTMVASQPSQAAEGAAEAGATVTMSEAVMSRGMEFMAAVQGFGRDERIELQLVRRPLTREGAESSRAELDGA